MDKNTLIGFLLIGVVLFAFSWFNRPTPEQLEAQRRYQDSIAKIEYAQQLELQKQENKSALVEDSLENLPDSVRAQRLQQSFGVFGDAMVARKITRPCKMTWSSCVSAIRADVFVMHA